MMGNIGIYLALTGAIIAAAAFFISSFLNSSSALKLSRFAFYLHALSIVTASIYLLLALLNHKFQYYYVYAYTEKALDFKYLISAFWAGQEGTFLLWALCGAVVGLVVIKYERKYEPQVMTIVSAAQFFLLLFLVVQSPFRLLPQVPLDGAGLNPLLQDPWMVIHPPVVFIGYTLLLVPYALALAGLWRREYHDWVTRALPWALAGWVTLGAGIIIGGYWAYRVLGWGGYWSWDPVENASLVPWLTAGAVIHGYLVQKRSQKLVFTNIFLSLITFVFILYATFLTRSGVLADFSVHSFVETPLTNYLILFILFFLGAGLLSVAVRYREIFASTSAGPVEKGISKVTLLIYGLAVLVASAVLISLGTSSPVLTSFWGSPASVDQSFYLITNTPIAIILSFLLAAIPFLKWRKEPLSQVVNRALPFLIGSGVGAAAAAAGGISSPVSLLYITAAVFALLSSGFELYRSLRGRGIKWSGGHLAHTGVALTLIGIIASMGYTQSEIVTLSQGFRQEVMGYSLLYEQKLYDEEKEQDIFELIVEDGRNTFQATPRMHFAGREPRLMREPFIRRYLWGDFYVSPLEQQQKKPGLVLKFTPGELRVVRGMQVTFLGFEILDHGEKIEVEALLEVTSADKTVTLAPKYYSDGKDHFSEASTTPDDGKAILESVHPEEEAAFIRFVSPFDEGASREVLVLEISFKPLITVLALGTVLLMAGTFIAAWRRFTE